MQDLYQRSITNIVDCRLISAEALKDMEPLIDGLGAIQVEATGIVDYKDVCQHMASEFVDRGGHVELGNPVLNIDENDKQISVSTRKGIRYVDKMVCCAGLQADRLVKLHGISPHFQIVPFRGEYYRLSRRFEGAIKHLIYPIPDPAMPFLGIHLTRMVDGTLTVGPNAVLGFKREGYGLINISLKDSVCMLSKPGFWRLIRQYIKPGMGELKNAWFKHAYLQQVRRYLPGISPEDLIPFPAGIRAQAVLSDGTLVHDFLFKETGRGLHVCNAPSPAATSAIPIGEYLCDHVSRNN
ncbi:MAG: L-2-hydroxyglutarate oxidase, partial [Gammaproteobacteria bacterium]|nr:L-2-hydroxyglutarate oxidase [Gammaproteobacteria bacterium]